MINYKRYAKKDILLYYDKQTIYTVKVTEPLIQQNLILPLLYDSSLKVSYCFEVVVVKPELIKKYLYFLHAR